MDSGLDVMERNVLHAELRGDFGVRAVEDRSASEALNRCRPQEKRRREGQIHVQLCSRINPFEHIRYWQKV